MIDEIVLASDNVGKIKEVNALLRGQRYAVVGQGKLGVVPGEETGTTFVENAILKAKNAALQTGRAAIADLFQASASSLGRWGEWRRQNHHHRKTRVAVPRSREIGDYRRR